EPDRARASEVQGGAGRPVRRAPVARDYNGGRAVTDADAALAEPFGMEAPDEATELAALARALELAEGFKLILVRYHSPAQRSRLIAQLQDRLRPRVLRVLEFDRPVEHLLDEIRARPAALEADGLCVTGLESTFTHEVRPRSVPLLANLNASR